MTAIKSIWDSHLLETEKYIKSKLDVTDKFHCFLATNQITGKRLFIVELQSPVDDTMLKSFKFRGLVVKILDYGLHKELTILLLDNNLENIFISFIENITEEIAVSNTNDELLRKISNVITRWKKLFDKAGFVGLTPEEQKGLLGELLLFNYLLLEGYPGYQITDSWGGPLGADKDYIFGSVGIEVKTTASKYPSVQITNERQLQNDTLTSLYLFLYIIEEVRDDGVTLPGLVTEIQDRLKDDQVILSNFNDKLKLTGFEEDDVENYPQRYVIRNLNKYVVDDNFPRLISNDLKTGIYNVSYRIELSACEDQKIISATVTELINGY